MVSEGCSYGRGGRLGDGMKQKLIDTALLFAITVFVMSVIAVLHFLPISMPWFAPEMVDVTTVNMTTVVAVTAEPTLPPVVIVTPEIVTTQGIPVAIELPEPEPTPTATAEPELIPLGEFKIYAYCPCRHCCGENAQGITATGTTATAGRTISVDPDVIPPGSTVYIDGQAYHAEDTGAGITGKTIDLFLDDHQAALEFGVQYKAVYLAN